MSAPRPPVGNTVSPIIQTAIEGDQSSESSQRLETDTYTVCTFFRDTPHQTILHLTRPPESHLDTYYLAKHIYFRDSVFYQCKIIFPSTSTNEAQHDLLFAKTAFNLFSGLAKFPFEKAKNSLDYARTIQSLLTQIERRTENYKNLMIECDVEITPDLENQILEVVLNHSFVPKEEFESKTSSDSSSQMQQYLQSKNKLDAMVIEKQVASYRDNLLPSIDPSLFPSRIIPPEIAALIQSACAHLQQYLRAEKGLIENTTTIQEAHALAMKKIESICKMINDANQQNGSLEAEIFDALPSSKNGRIKIEKLLNHFKKWDLVHRLAIAGWIENKPADQEQFIRAKRMVDEIMRNIEQARTQIDFAFHAELTYRSFSSPIISKAINDHIKLTYLYEAQDRLITAEFIDDSTDRQIKYQEIAANMQAIVKAIKQANQNARDFRQSHINKLNTSSVKITEEITALLDDLETCRRDYLLGKMHFCDIKADVRSNLKKAENALSLAISYSKVTSSVTTQPPEDKENDLFESYVHSMRLFMKNNDLIETAEIKAKFQELSELYQTTLQLKTHSREKIFALNVTYIKKAELKKLIQQACREQNRFGFLSMLMRKKGANSPTISLSRSTSTTFSNSFTTTTSGESALNLKDANTPTPTRDFLLETSELTKMESTPPAGITIVTPEHNSALEVKRIPLASLPVDRHIFTPIDSSLQHNSAFKPTKKQEKPKPQLKSSGLMVP